MRTFWLLTTVAAAIFLEWALQTWSFFGITPPLISGTVLFWFQRLSLPQRIWLGAAAGMLLDSVSAFPFGTYIIAFFIEAVLVEFLKFLFTKPDESLVKAVVAGVPFFLFFALLPLNALFLDAFRRGSSFVFANYLMIFLGACWWTFWYVLAVVAGSWLRKKFI